MARDPQPEAWTRLGWVLVAAAFLVGFANFPLRVVRWQLDFLPGDGADNRLNNYVLEHGYRYLTGREASFWSPPIFYPTPGVTAWSDAHLGTLPIYAAFRAVGLNPEQACRGWFLVPFLLNYAAAVWALRRLGAGPAGAAAGAVVFTFPLALIAQISHGQLFPRFLVPVAVVFAWEFLREPRTWRLAAAAACVVGQTYLTVYIGYFLVLLLAGGLFVTVVRFGRQLPWGELLRPGWRAWARRAVVVALAGLALLPLATAHMNAVGGVAPDVIRQAAPKPAWWVTAAPLTAAPEFAGAVAPDSGLIGEAQLFPGWVPLLAVFGGLFAIVRPHPRLGRVAAVAVAAWAAVLLAVLVTRFGGAWPYAPLTHVPGAGGIRAIGRIVLVLVFPAAVAVAGAAHLLVRWAGQAGRVPAGVAAVLVVAAAAGEQWLTPTDGPRAHLWAPGQYPAYAAYGRRERIAAAVLARPGATLVYVFPSAAVDPASPVALQLEAMRACQDLGIPCVNGWSGYLPEEWNFFRGYRGLMEWLTVSNAVPADRLAGLVVVGEPEPDADPVYEAAMRAAYPPRPVPPR